MEWIRQPFDKLPKGDFELLGAGEMFNKGGFFELREFDTREEWRVEVYKGELKLYKWGER